MKKALLVFLVVIIGAIVLTMPASGWLKYTDINADGTKEKILWQEKSGESYYLGTMTISCKNKVIFEVKNLLVTAMEEAAIRIVDVDPRFPGSEILVMTPSDTALIEGEDSRCVD